MRATKIISEGSKPLLQQTRHLSDTERGVHLTLAQTRLTRHTNKPTGSFRAHLPNGTTLTSANSLQQTSGTFKKYTTEEKGGNVHTLGHLLAQHPIAARTATCTKTDATPSLSTLWLHHEDIKSMQNLSMAPDNHGEHTTHPLMEQRRSTSSNQTKNSAAAHLRQQRQRKHIHTHPTLQKHRMLHLHRLANNPSQKTRNGKPPKQATPPCLHPMQKTHSTSSLHYTAGGLKRYGRQWPLFLPDLD